jgi:hypothetical protein
MQVYATYRYSKHSQVKYNYDIYYTNYTSDKAVSFRTVFKEDSAGRRFKYVAGTYIVNE